MFTLLKKPIKNTYPGLYPPAELMHPRARHRTDVTSCPAGQNQVHEFNVYPVSPVSLFNELHDCHDPRVDSPAALRTPTVSAPRPQISSLLRSVRHAHLHRAGRSIPIQVRHFRLRLHEIYLSSLRLFLCRCSDYMQLHGRRILHQYGRRPLCRTRR